MSIPPLVCSTPPPPDQCEEDKDPDDFVISYDLSQDDDDDGFNYGEYSSYNHYPTNCLSQKNDVLADVEPRIPSEDKQVVNETFHEKKWSESENISTPNENKTKSDEDTNIEDLGLEVDKESLSSNEKEEKSDTEYNVESSEKVLEVTDISDASNTQSSPIAENVVAVDRNHCKEIVDDQMDESSTDLDPLPSEPNSVHEEHTKSDEIADINEHDAKESSPDDDFGEFDDFQFASTERKSSEVIESCDNPWDSGDVADSSDFGNFTANFDAVNDQNLEISENVEKVTDDLNFKVQDEDDDFGDFDDFKSSAISSKNEEISDELNTESNMPVLNFNTLDEQQITESISKVLSSIFETELTEPGDEFEGTLESVLSETWRHLRETDIRQPYILNWNNSLGQKTLLRALCIDSRNILYGPKWSHNTPKYVNLSTAPLQPQKPSPPTQTEAKPSPKPAWTDPFTADGQEFTYAESLLLDLEHLMATLDQMAHSHSTLKISELLSHACSTESESAVEVTATDLDVFEAAVTRKPDKIYSSTLNVQPLRQISLPDTHIFTPSDSETPTSTTVHYSPPILVPQTNIDTKIPEVSSQTNTPTKDEDYWEFQGFKSGSDKSSIQKNNSVTEQEGPVTLPETKTDSPKPNTTYQTQVLQPIRMEPLIPTVNWPDPGEIKETFEDFTDFISNSSWNDKAISTPPEKLTDSETLVVTNTKHKNPGDLPKILDSSADDEFATFQAAPTKHILASSTFNNIPQSQTDFAVFPQSSKSENISVNSVGLPSLGTEAFAYKSAPNTSQLLQPIPNSTQKQSGQILQPLSLESYSQINWPNPGIDLQDLSRFNPVETVHSLKSDSGGPSKGSSPAHSQKGTVPADDDWGDFVSSKPKQNPAPKKQQSFIDDDEWTDFVSSPNVMLQNGLNTISLNVHTNSNIQKSNKIKSGLPIDIPTLNYITPKSSGSKPNDRHFQNL